MSEVALYFNTLYVHQAYTSFFRPAWSENGRFPLLLQYRSLPLTAPNRDDEISCYSFHICTEIDTYSIYLVDSADFYDIVPFFFSITSAVLTLVLVCFNLSLILLAWNKIGVCISPHCSEYNHNSIITLIKDRTSTNSYMMCNVSGKLGSRIMIHRSGFRINATRPF